MTCENTDYMCNVKSCWILGHEKYNNVKSWITLLLSCSSCELVCIDLSDAHSFTRAKKELLSDIYAATHEKPCEYNLLFISKLNLSWSFCFFFSVLPLKFLTPAIFFFRDGKAKKKRNDERRLDKQERKQTNEPRRTLPTRRRHTPQRSTSYHTRFATFNVF